MQPVGNYLVKRKASAEGVFNKNERKMIGTIKTSDGMFVEITMTFQKSDYCGSCTLELLNSGMLSARSQDA